TSVPCPFTQTVAFEVSPWLVHPYPWKRKTQKLSKRNNLFRLLKHHMRNKKRNWTSQRIKRQWNCSSLSQKRRNRRRILTSLSWREIARAGEQWRSSVEW